MAGKPIDFDGMISVYETINKQRDLTPEESARLAHLVDRKTKAGYAKKYREANKAKLLKQRQKWYSENKAKHNAARMRYHHKYNAHNNRKAKEWREANPDKVKAYKENYRKKQNENLRIS